jgi:hypothetical protein
VIQLKIFTFREKSGRTNKRKFFLLRQVHSFFQRDFSIEGDRVFPLSISIILSMSLRSSIICLRLLPRLPVTSILPSLFPTITCFRSQFLSTIWQPSQPCFFLLHIGYCFPPLFCVILHLAHDRSNWSPSFSSTTYRKFPGISGKRKHEVKVSGVYCHKIYCSM